MANSEFRIEKKGGGFSILNSAFAIRNYLATLGVTALLYASNPHEHWEFLGSLSRTASVTPSAIAAVFAAGRDACSPLACRQE
jgi:hypothetical protein